ncbi:hybrid sensor histidine kinase/response regulator [Roseofilum casamattae]|uniref:histidine kinase n=1 Tax=Roseofilum casamattae BLCC-M143 TaxID=3022442 RepID=A0ABT7BVC3_9CYAN|nr:response regulator [Roseofilum casamattae]MDJ1182228.1 response regulator [Roseofilum casamattae BLCC-M143]
MSIHSTHLGQIAVVDDTAANLHLLFNLLGNSGYDVRPFPKGTIAFEGITYSPPDLILLDIQMPEMNGYELCQKLKANELTENIPIIFISALNETFDKVKAFQVGGVDYITKPFQTEEILARVATHLELYQIKRQLQNTNSFQAEQLAVQNTQLQHLNQSLERVNQELKSNYERLKKAQLQLVQTEKMATLGNLVAGVAHEINNPLGFINGSVSTLENSFTDLLEIVREYRQEYPEPRPQFLEVLEDLDFDFLVEDIPKIIASMQMGIARISKISTSLRTFSRGDKVQKSLFNPHDALDSTLIILKYRLKANDRRPDIEIVKNYGDIPDFKCYAGQINQVFMNIFSNAIDALDESNIGKSFKEIEAAPNCITINTQFNREENSIAVRISDNGTGMTEPVRVRIFEQGFTTKEVGKGTGLGMAIVRQIIEEQHGGTIACQSEVGKGTAFTIVLPLN